MGVKVAVLGATGNVGREMLAILAEREFPADDIIALASRRSLGREVSFGDRTLKCRDADNFDYSTVDLVLMSAGGGPSKTMSPKIAAAGALVIDNSSAWRMDPDVPLIVPEVNPDAIHEVRKNIIANPNCSTIQLVVALAPLHAAAQIRRVVVATYQSVSGAGKEAMDELWTQTKGIFVNDRPEPHKFTKQIAFNLIPHIGSFLDSGYTDEEAKMWNETKKMIDPSIALTVTCVRAPVFVGHSEAVNIEFEKPLSADDAREILSEAPGLVVIDRHDDGGYITPVEAAGEFSVFVSRIRNDHTVPDNKGLAMWVVGDNLRKGAALNAIQIAELAIERGVLKPRSKAA